MAVSKTTRYRVRRGKLVVNLDDIQSITAIRDDFYRGYCLGVRHGIKSANINAVYGLAENAARTTGKAKRPRKPIP